MAAWAPLVPFAKARAGLDDGTLGVLLLALGAGSMVAMPLAGALASRMGCRPVLLLSFVVASLMLPALATLSSPLLLALALLVFGASIGSADCVMNMQAVIVERDSGRPMMSGFHGLYSLGGIVGAGGVSLLLWAGATPLVATLAAVGLLLAATAYASPHFLRHASRGDGPAFAMPHGTVLFIGVLCFILFLTEGSVLDWSAVFLTAERGMDPAHGGLGYAAFSATMTAGRLTGDAVVRRLGGIPVIMGGALCAAAGLGLATLVPSGAVALLGYALVGLGCSNIVPVLFTATGRQTAMPEHIAIPAVTTLGYAGILAGPAGIGLLAHATSLPFAFLAVVVLLLGVAASARVLKV
ncbi:transporter, major facilitator family protein [Acetobacteraceae bacterium AT-5844]|nr:transporter, major facilitator family protein [Acetobacteraceae bacterium AT-5844]